MSDYNSDLRNEIIKSGGTFGYLQIYPEAEVSEMQLYLKTMEKLIEEQEQNDVNRLDHEARNLTTEQQLAYWTECYPVYWDEIFKHNLRSHF